MEPFKPTPKTVSIIIPAYNEEGNIRNACLEIAAVAERHLEDYEILVFDDASLDRTSEVVREIQTTHPRIELIRNRANKGLGFNYRAGVMKARFAYSILVPGDNEVVAQSLEPGFREVGNYDVLVCYAENPEARSRGRQFVSRAFTQGLNLLFGLQLKYYNGTCIIRTPLARKFLPITSSFAYMAVMLVRLVKSGASYAHFPFKLRQREHGTTKAFGFKNICFVIRDVMKLFWELQILKRDPAAYSPAGPVLEEPKILQAKI